MNDILIKAYGWLELTNHAKLLECLNALHAVCREWYLEESIFSLEGSLLQISHEGSYFPHEDVALILAKYINEESKGKLDILDLEAWILLRFFLDAKHNSILLAEKTVQLPYSRKSSLNHAIEAAQEKCGDGFKAK